MRGVAHKASPLTMAARRRLAACRRWCLLLLAMGCGASKADHAHHPEADTLPAEAQRFDPTTQCSYTEDELLACHKAGYTVQGKLERRDSFSEVYEGFHDTTGRVVALRCVPCVQYDKSKIMNDLRELLVLRHPTMPLIWDVWDTEDSVFYAQDVAGAEILEVVSQWEEFTEKDSAILVQQILEGINYLHVHGIVHQDLRPRNIRCDGKKVFITETGMQTIKDGRLSYRYLVKTKIPPIHVPPEVAKDVLVDRSQDSKSFTSKGDIWSVGVILYTLLCGNPPMWSENSVVLLQRISKAEYDLTNNLWSKISSKSKTFLQQMLTEDPEKRPSAVDCISHNWIQCRDDLPTVPLHISLTLTDFIAQQKGRRVREARMR
uniref:Protein kinase domain-containing protein n=2 Tax=Guillardia theta TaxID=55529 RepID=A0A7S4P3T7_GUITH|mmetsp:Transcript_4277/g.15680  ORF Transcript_4277/g.15680 Transcript_4277/m.15680 type:complete len:376 (+) Transcript_4277:29-1156(+)